VLGRAWKPGSAWRRVKPQRTGDCSAMSQQQPPPAKRARAPSRDPPPDDSASEGDDVPPGTRPGPAARKRELERQRRNLVSTRFAELDSVLALDGAAPTDKAAARQPARRIDKEAILKDAATRITAQSMELSTAQQRLSFMSNEVENLRAEKVELRADKAYLHSELTAIRSEVQRLRADNIHLWQAIRRSGGLKSALSTDVAKIPAELLLRAPKANLASNLYRSGEDAALAQRSHAGTQEQQQVRKQHDSMTAPPPPPPPPPPQQQQKQQQLHHQALVAPEAAHSTMPAADAHAHDLSRGPALNPPDRPQPRSDLETTSLVDSFLVFQSPEELGELFADYTDSVPPVPFDHQERQGGSATGIDNSASAPAAAQSAALPSESGGVGTPRQPQTGRGNPSYVHPSALPRGNPGHATTFGAEVSTDERGRRVEDDAEEDDFLADVAYCA
jgi:hypothetical protein